MGKTADTIGRRFCLHPKSTRTVETRRLRRIIVTKKEVVVIASRATALYLIFWALDNLSYVPIDAFSLSHYSALPQEYIYQYHLVLLSHHMVASVLFFVGAVWVYRCGPSVEKFLLPSES
jgi:hypothetical protein